MTREEIEVALLGSGDAAAFDHVDEDVFDGPVQPAALAAFLSDPSALIAVARERRAGGLIVGFASGQIYAHPDKPPTLWINEVGVAERRRRIGLGRALVERLFAAAKTRGVSSAWVATEGDNAPARALYRALGGAETGDIVMAEFTLE